MCLGDVSIGARDAAVLVSPLVQSTNAARTASRGRKPHVVPSVKSLTRQDGAALGLGPIRSSPSIYHRLHVSTPCSFRVEGDTGLGSNSCIGGSQSSVFYVVVSPV